ncbi:MAG: hypothetical protein H7196_04280 [candidate division SR1 bacterium]|nr:hypothetical protein [candidate division SR1 bacterium]
MKQSYITIQLPFKDRGEEKSSGPETLEEIGAVQAALKSININQYTSFHFIGKSLGGLILQRFIVQSSLFNTHLVKFTILGYLIGDVTISSLKTKTYVIQGENDPYGDPKLVQEELDFLKISKLNIIIGADHSYRNSRKNPVYQDTVVSLIEI